MRLQTLVPLARMYGPTLAASWGRPGWWKRAGDEQARGNDVLVDLQVDRQPDGQIGDGRKLAVQRLDKVAQTKGALGARQRRAGRPLSNSWTDAPGASLSDLRGRQPTATAVMVAAPLTGCSPISWQLLYGDADSLTGAVTSTHADVPEIIA